MRRIDRGYGTPKGLRTMAQNSSELAATPPISARRS